LGYHVETGRYWEEQHRFAPTELDKVDALWLTAFGATFASGHESAA
jgi:hypothetical protein